MSSAIRSLGTVSSIAPLTVLLDGSSSGAPFLNYTGGGCTVGDRIVVIHIGTQLYAISTNATNATQDLSGYETTSAHNADVSAIDAQLTPYLAAIVTTVPSTADGDVAAPATLTITLVSGGGAITASLAAGMNAGLVVGKYVWVVMVSGAAVIVGYRTRTIDIATFISDWNLAIGNGAFNGDGASNSPESGVWLIGHTVTHSADYHTQTVSEMTVSNPRMWIRTCVGGTWNSWVQFGVNADRWVGTEAMLVGSTPPAGALKITNGASAVVSTDTSGAATVSISADKVFPNGVASLVATIGDGGPGFVLVENVTKSSFGVQVYYPGGSVVNGGVRINWMAVGY